MCFVGQIVNQQQRQLLAWHKGVLPKLTTEAAPEEVTGLLLLYPSHFLHVVEAELTQLTEFARALVPLTEKEDLTMEVRVLACTDDIPSRMFTGWQSSIVGQHSASAAPSEGVIHVPLPTRIADTYISLLKLGRALAHAKGPEREGMLADLRTRHAETLPTQNLLSEVAQAEDALKVAEFVHIFTKPIDIKLNREVWPVETELVY
ncbi:hypothetical protein T492DRAFT_1001391 [Pavlovales sp. CCMP2436]|nr:hypothetical protein T492DRAFT_1001391 [Pavlovales sp. CCMP2436]